MQTCVQFRSFSHPTCWFELLRMENRNWGGGLETFTATVFLIMHNTVDITDMSLKT